MDALGKLCTDGKQLADYLWQVPDDAAVRQQILGILEQIAVESAKQGRREMPRICEDLKTAAKRSEEHTSELQSQSNLVCRLLLEKKKTHLQPGRDDRVPPPVRGA